MTDACSETSPTPLGLVESMLALVARERAGEASADLRAASQPRPAVTACRRAGATARLAGRSRSRLPLPARSMRTRFARS